jgi:hypothetical protein
MGFILFSIGFYLLTYPPKSCFMPPDASSVIFVNKHHSMIDNNKFFRYIFVFSMKYYIEFIAWKVSSFDGNYFITNWMV